LHRWHDPPQEFQEFIEGSLLLVKFRHYNSFFALRPLAYRSLNLPGLTSNWQRFVNKGIGELEVIQEQVRRQQLPPMEGIYQFCQPVAWKHQRATSCCLR
jgi:hypothetical protein